MAFLPSEPYKKILCAALYIALGSFFLYALLRFLLPAVFPFIIGFIIAASVKRPARFLAEKSGGGVKFFSVLLGLLFISALSLAVFFTCSKLISELSSFVSGLAERRDQILSAASELVGRIERALYTVFPSEDGIDKNIRESLSSFLGDTAKNILSSLTTKLPALIGTLFSSLPKIIFSVFATLIATVYFCCDYDEIRVYFGNIMKKKPFSCFSKLKRAYLYSFSRYIRAYFIIFIMTAAELTLGFLIIGIKYSLLLGVITAFIDILPVLGSGAVVLPMAILNFVSGNFKTGVGLLVLYIAVSIIRQISEPKIIGKNLGIHPLASLFFVYAGYRIFGLVGMIFLPIIAVMAKNIFGKRAARV